MKSGKRWYEHPVVFLIEGLAAVGVFTYIGVAEAFLDGAGLITLIIGGVLIGGLGVGIVVVIFSFLRR